jgi:hypothetical protein
MKLISLFLVLAAEILTKRGYWLALVLIDSKYIKKRQGTAAGLSRWFAASFFCKCLFLFFIFFKFLIMVFWVSPFLGFLSNCLLFSFFSYPEICIYSVRVLSRVRNQVSIKLILLFEVWIWSRIKFESG